MKINRLLQLDSILLFAFVIPFIMAFRIGPKETPYWLFGIIFFSLIAYICLDILHLKEKIYLKAKDILLWIIIFIVLGSAFGSAIIVRHQTHPIYMVHDSVLQQEEAIRFLITGKNPYASTFLNTPLALWHYSETEINPALYHFVYEPFYILSAIPFYFVSNNTIGYFDGRIPLLVTVFLALFIAQILVKDAALRRQFIIFLAFSPVMLGYTLEGRSDMYVYGLFIVGLYLLYKKHLFLAGIPLGLAFATKQSVWPFFPFYVAFLYFETNSVKKTLKNLSLFSVTFLGVVLPFFLWDQQAFLSSTIYFLSGSTEHSYPVSGYGFGSILRDFGFITNPKLYFPFQIFQAIIGIPVVIILILYLKKNPTVKRTVLVYGLFLFIFWYFSRFFNNSHLAYLSIIFITAYFFPEKQTDT